MRIGAGQFVAWDPKHSISTLVETLRDVLAAQHIVHWGGQ